MKPTLKGYTVPRSPLGHAAIDPPPPWHYSGDVIAVEFWADPAATASLLPTGLAVDPKADGHAVAMFVDWQFTGQLDEHLDPARYQYREAFVLLDAVWQDRPVNFCPFIYVDNDAALARGWIQGFPKRIGSVFQTRSHQAPSPAAAIVGPGARYAASLSVHGHRCADARITLRQPVQDPFSVVDRPTVLLRYFPRLVAGQQEQPAVNELTLSITDDLRLVNMWSGDAELSFPSVPGEELDLLGPVEVGLGYRFGMAYSVTTLEVLRNFAA